ncbi:MAG: phage capsid protein [Pseudohongiellaceae bacterium]
MSKFLSDAASQMFDDEVKHQYQAMDGAGALEGTVTVRRNVVGNTYNFRRMGRGVAKQKTVSQADLIPLDVAHTLIPAVLQNWHASEYTDIFDKADVNFDEVSELAMTIAWALKRREDQLIIDAVSQPPAAAGTPIADIVLATVFTVTALRRASGALNARGVMGRMRHCAITALSLEHLLASTNAVSGDFNTVRALVNGEIDTFVGFMFHMIDDRDEGGILGAAANKELLFWHEMSTGLAIGIDFETTVDWVPQKGSWLSSGFLKAQSVVRDAGGVVTVQVDETAAVTVGPT